MGRFGNGIVTISLCSNCKLGSHKKCKKQLRLKRTGEFCTCQNQQCIK